MIRQIIKQWFLGISLFGCSSLALAHPGHGIESAAAGFMHTFSGWDHLLVMIAIGLVAAKATGVGRLKMPLTFLVTMGLGIFLGLAGYAISGVETAVAASVIAMGLLLLISLPINATLRLGIVALFGLFHGMAHGVEMNMQYQTILGVLLASALLHGVGLVIGLMHFKLATWVQTSLAVCMMALGAYGLM
jgi:urease accessory protein